MSHYMYEQEKNLCEILIKPLSFVDRIDYVEMEEQTGIVVVYFKE